MSLGMARSQGGKFPWSVCFSTDQIKPTGMQDPLGYLEARRDEILTGRLGATLSLNRSIQGGNVTILHNAKNSAFAPDPIEILRVVASHSLIARSLLVPILRPGFWIRMNSDMGMGEIARPVLPTVHLMGLLDMDRPAIHSVISPLIEDGAIEMVRPPSGYTGVLLREGFLDETRTSRFLRA